MPIVFDEIEGVVQPSRAEQAEPSSSAGAEHDIRDPDFERKLREWLAAERRRHRLTAD